MGEAPKEVQLEIATEDHELFQGIGPNALLVKEEKIDVSTAVDPRPKSYKWWIRVSIYSVFVVAGHAVATLLERLYFEKGGKSKWLATFIQLVGFPLLIPLYWFTVIKSRNEPGQDPKTPQPSYKVLAFVYVSIGVLVAVNSFLYTLGILYLPVSTYSLICATQLAFNALFSFFLNSQKFTPYIINSLVLLTISSTLLVFNPESSSNNNTTANPTSKSSYMVGFISTVAASAVYGLCLSLTQLAFRKVIKQETFKAVLEMLIYQYLVATCVIFVGLFASGDWKHLNREMEDFKLGKLSYVMTLTWSAITWGLFSVGAVGLIFEVSALFSNSICTVGLPVIPVLATVFFHDSMDGIKVISMVLAIWGCVSYIYQHYLDDMELQKKTSCIVSGSEKSSYDAK